MIEIKVIYLDVYGFLNMVKVFFGKLLLGVEIKYMWIKNKYFVKNI